MKLEVTNLWFSYNGNDPTIQDISFSVDGRETLVVIGPNGSGKSTLLKCIVNILKPQGGSIMMDETDIKGMGSEERARRIGYVPQLENRGFPATVFDTILMGRKPYISWKPSSSDLEVVSSIIEMLGLEEFSIRDINSLSGGQRQKVLIARALAQEPDILLLDEPTSNLDLKHQLEVLNILKDQTGKGIASVIAIHDLNMAVRYADRIVMLSEGKVFASGGLDIITANRIAEVYGVRVAIGKHAGWLTVTAEEPLD